MFSYAASIISQLGVWSVSTSPHTNVVPDVPNPETPNVISTLASALTRKSPNSNVPDKPVIKALAFPLTEGAPKNPVADTPVTSTNLPITVDAVPKETAALAPSTDTSITGDP